MTTGGRKDREDRPSGRRKDHEIRSEYQRDLDRVIYDYYFRRLANITQISSGTGKILRHNRMTHSLKVGQVGRRLVQYLQADPENAAGIEAAGGLDADVVDAAGLLHDAGHPPFGHVAEDELNQLALSHGLVDGFEGNAQTLRIIFSLGTHRSSDAAEAEPGLDLTHAVTAACVKYPWPRVADGDNPSRKWGVYETERKEFERWVVPFLPKGENGYRSTLEAEVMDWADDITYAVHDLQDFFVDGVIPLHRLRHRDDGPTATPVHHQEMSNFWAYASERIRERADRGRHAPPLNEAQKLFGAYACRFPTDPYQGLMNEKAAVGALASQIITDASLATSVRPNGRLHVDPKTRTLIDILKLITWFYVIDRPELVTIQIGQRAKVDELFRKLFKWTNAAFAERDVEGSTRRSYTQEEKWIRQRKLPVDLQHYIRLISDYDHNEGAYKNQKQIQARGILDYIASMTEDEFDDMHARLTRGSRLSSMPAGRLD